ncbi:ribonuclease H [Xylariaceae sp. FL0016]|nr:ribonuclease H [Xylariaceae sp. FL0016]
MPPKRAAAAEASKSKSQPTQSGKKRKVTEEKFYGVRAGHNTGVYTTWEEANEQISGYKGCQFKSFNTRREAADYVAGKDTGEAKFFYALANGDNPGIFRSWPQCQIAKEGVKGAKFKKFNTRDEAIEFIRESGNDAAQDWLVNEEGIEPPNKKAKKAAPGATSKADGPDVLHVYTDGASRGNGKAGATAGFGIYFGENDDRNVSERLEGGEQTNNRAELTAILRALEIVPTSQKVRIFSDSQYCLSCILEWYKGWEAKNWKKSDGGKVLNQDLIKRIRELLDERDEVGTGTLFQKVKGHAAVPGNVAADLLAVEGAKKRI